MNAIYKKSIGDRIKNLREKANISQLELSKKININNSVLNRIESNERPLRDEEIVTISNYFNVTTDYLLGYSKEPEFTTEDEADILKRLKAITEDLDSNTELMFDGEILDDETRELFRGALHTALVLSKKKAKAGLPTWKDYLKG